MEEKRPYSDRTVEELSKIFEANQKNESVLKTLKEELSHRTMSKAKDLSKKVTFMLDNPKYETYPFLKNSLLGSPPKQKDPQQEIDQLYKEIQTLHNVINSMRNSKTHAVLVGISLICIFIGGIGVFNTIEGIFNKETQILLIVAIFGILSFFYTHNKEKNEERIIKNYEDDIDKLYIEIDKWKKQL